MPRYDFYGNHTGVFDFFIYNEDIMEKNSTESYFIQICDFVSFFVHLYFMNEFRNKELPKRVGNVIDDIFVK